MPVLGADPSPSSSPLDASPSAAASQAPAASPAPAATPAPTAAPKAQPSKEPKPDKTAKPERGPKAAKAPEVPITLRGTVAVATDGRWPAYTLSSGGTTYELSAGPPWWWGASNPLAKAVGKSVTIGGERVAGSAEVDVLTIDGVAVREAGRPPWAGGWKDVGARHPGWAQWKADKMADKAANHPGRGLGRDDAPGQQQP